MITATSPDGPHIFYNIERKIESILRSISKTLSKGKSLLIIIQGEIYRMRSLITLIILTLGVTFGASAQDMGMKASDNPSVGGAAMYRTKNIIENAVNSKDHTTLVTAAKAAGLVETLASAGPFTVFAPVNTAFEKLPAGTVETLLKPENKATLAKILTYHVVAGNFDSKAVIDAIKKGKGKAKFTTVSGGTLYAMLDGNKVVLKDETGGKSTVTIADVRQSNGVIHVIDSVVMPK